MRESRAEIRERKQLYRIKTPSLRAIREAERRNKLEAVAAKMRAYNLTHGSGCRSTARAIERRKAK